MEKSSHNYTGLKKTMNSQFKIAKHTSKQGTIAKSRQCF